MYQNFYTKCDSYNKEYLKEAIEKILAPLAGELGSFNNKSIMIKPNLLAYRKDEDPACVHPNLIVAIVEYLLSCGAKQVAIIENPAVKTAPAVLADMKIATRLKELNVQMANCNNYQISKLPEICSFHQLELAQEYKDFDIVINLAKLKTHGMMTLTMGVKNLFGLVRGSERLGWHLAVGKDYEKFADMLLDIYLTVKPHITIIDAIIAMEGNGPGSGTPTKLGFLAAGNDAIALDDAIAKKLNIKDIPQLKRAYARNLVSDYIDNGDVLENISLKLPDPPRKELAWGVYFPPKLRNFLRQHLISKPVVVKKDCVGCGVCVAMCPPATLKIIKGKPKFDLTTCIRCYCCQEHCPKGAIFPKKTLGMKIAETLERIFRLNH